MVKRTMKTKKRSKKKIITEVTSDPTNDKQLAVYLQTWSANRDEWKFEKVKQIRLVAGMLDSDKVPDKVFPIFIEYMENAKGKIRTIITNKATQIVEEMEKWVSLTSEEQEKVEKPDSNKYNRARTILQTLF